MPVIDPSEFWTQALSSLLAGVLVLFVQPQWLVGLFRPRSDPARLPSASGPSNLGGNQLVISAESTVYGGIQQRNKYVKKTQHTTIITNINAAARDRNDSDSDEWGRIFLAFIAAVVAAGVFLVLRPLFLALSVGATAGLLLMTLAAVIRSRRDLDAWPRQARLAVYVVPVATAIVILSWILVSTTTRESLSLDLIGARLPVSDPTTSGASLPDRVSAFFQTTVPAIVHMGMPTILFVVALIGGVLLALTMVISAWFLVLDWHAYLRFTDGTEPGSVTARRAEAFTKRKVLPEIVMVVVVGCVALVFSGGFFYDLTQALQPQLQQFGAIQATTATGAWPTRTEIFDV